MADAESDSDPRVIRVRALFVERHPSADRSAVDVFAFSEWLLRNQPELLPANRGTFYRDLKAALRGLWKD